MYDKRNYDYEDGNNHDYSPNELAELSVKNNELYRSIVRQNIPDNLTIEQWENNNLKRMQEHLKRY